MVLITQLVAAAIMFFFIRSGIRLVCERKLDKLRRKGPYPGRASDLINWSIAREVSTYISLVVSAGLILLAMGLFLL